MSIPPLVCSTPPPPDQCEDDKDPEDFDLHYNLSQEDDYDYGSFSTYNHFQPAITVNKPSSDPLSINNVNNADSSRTVKVTSGTEILQSTNTATERQFNYEQEPKIDLKPHNDSEIIEIHEEELKTKDTLSLEDLHTDKKINNEEDLNIEDLNLTVEEDSLNSIVKNEQYDNNTDSDKSDHSDKEKSSHIPDVTASIITGDLRETLPKDEITISPPSIDNVDDTPNSIDDLKMDDENCTDIDIKNEPESDPTMDTSDFVETVQVTETFKEVTSLNNETDDEFGDFNDFHTTSETKAETIGTVVDACDNPWGNNQTGSDFGAFEAHFEDTGNNEPPLFEDFKSADKTASDSSSDHEVADDDDFGDFDDFKSSAQDAVNEDIHDPLSRVPVLDFQKSESESQLLENINKILYSIFEEDIPEPESVFDGKLEAMLCETWGHLLETDVRQPYIVNWNSSIGQKTLLKALCIDSRNILFGPKWSYNMPKYAANLSVAPLQPQKQTTASGQNPAETISDKPTKTLGTWSDPFTSDGQESCNKENTAATPKRPTDLDVFNTALPTKSDKIYSSTLDVQPIRQINLPDTHIFTPTDSETPRSKTIHYNGPTFLSQSSVEANKNPIEEKTAETPTDTKVIDDADYTDFQDFKGSIQIDTLEAKPIVLSTDSITPPANTSQMPSTSASYSIGILQPIKIEPIMPTLNWPSPGEVKETFDDFTEFASATTWNSDAQETRTPGVEPIKTPHTNDAGVIKDNSIKFNEEPPSRMNDSFDDDFDTFQSAVPNEPTQLAPSIGDFSNFVASDFNQPTSTPGTSHAEPELDFGFPKLDVKSDPISFKKTNDIVNNSDFIYQNNSAISVPKSKEAIAKAPVPSLAPPLSTVLQPTVTPQTHQNSAQILQPLSLESFSQINWPNPGINLQDLSRFNPVETLNSLKSDLSVSGNSKGASPVHSQKASVQSQLPEDDIWGEFVSSKPKTQQSLPKKATTFADDDEWTDFVSSPTVKPQNGLNTISLNVHTNLSIQKSTKQTKQNSQALEIPITHYITPKSNHNSYNDRHFQNL